MTTTGPLVCFSFWPKCPPQKASCSNPWCCKLSSNIKGRKCISLCSCCWQCSRAIMPVRPPTCTGTPLASSSPAWKTLKCWTPSAQSRAKPCVQLWQGEGNSYSGFAGFFSTILLVRSKKRGRGGFPLYSKIIVGDSDSWSISLTSRYDLRIHFQVRDCSDTKITLLFSLILFHGLKLYFCS